MPTVTVTLKKANDVSISGTKTFTFATLERPAGTSWYRYKVTNPSFGSSVALQGKLGTVGRGNWDTHKSYIEWDEDESPKPSVTVYNGTGNKLTNFTITLTVEFTVKSVTQGSIIKKYVRDALIASGSTAFDVHIAGGPEDALVCTKFSSGTSAKASTFNDKFNLD